MGQYGKAASIAAEMLVDGAVNDPEKAWKRAVRKVTDSPSARNKVCPRGAFLGLVEAGAIRGLSPRSRSFGSDNGRYATTALAALRRDPALLNDRQKLWLLATKGSQKKRNGQMDVLVGLWESGYINPE